jgi:large subunit ribosomal protein L30
MPRPVKLPRRRNFSAKNPKAALTATTQAEALKENQASELASVKEEAKLSHESEAQPDTRPILRIKWVKSSIGYAKDQKATIRSLGLRKLQRTVERRDHPTLRGMLHKVRHLVQVEEIPQC